ncbi:sugar phosphate nucleotidyltransferase [Novosphingobium sp.]|uniref:sugar phosphate nucleotidyltransferase n=1 Tax=Novosphingobium sp. TaxID=1874826 RepID=UPI0035B330EE
MTVASQITVVVLAGGKGTRLKGLYPDTPKPMIPVAGKPFLHWITRWIALHGPQHFVYSTGHLSQQVEEWAADASMPDLKRECVREDVPLGTGGGLMNCIDRCGEWTMVVNGDGLVMRGMAQLLALADAPGDGGLLGVEVDDTSRYGSLESDADGRLTGFREKVPGRGLINGGIYLLRTELLRALYRPGNLSIETDLFPEMLAAGANLRVIGAGEAPFIDIGTPETISQAEAFVHEHLGQAQPD